MISKSAVLWVISGTWWMFAVAAIARSTARRQAGLRGYAMPPRHTGTPGGRAARSLGGRGHPRVFPSGRCIAQLMPDRETFAKRTSR
jgi:hypothetical protein